MYENVQKSCKGTQMLISFNLNCYIAFDMCECVFLRKKKHLEIE